MNAASMNADTLQKILNNSSALFDGLRRIASVARVPYANDRPLEVNDVEEIVEGVVREIHQLRSYHAAKVEQNARLRNALLGDFDPRDWAIRLRKLVDEVPIFEGLIRPQEFAGKLKQRAFEKEDIPSCAECKWLFSENSPKCRQCGNFRSARLKRDG